MVSIFDIFLLQIKHLSRINIDAQVVFKLNQILKMKNKLLTYNNRNMQTQFQPHNITAIREKSDGLTIILTFLFVFITYLASLFERL